MLSFFVPFCLCTDVPRRELSPRATDSKWDLWEEGEKTKALVVSPKCAGTSLRVPLPHRDGEMVVLAAPYGFWVVSRTFPRPPFSPFPHVITTETCACHLLLEAPSSGLPIPSPFHFSGTPFPCPKLNCGHFSSLLPSRVFSSSLSPRSCQSPLFNTNTPCYSAQNHPINDSRGEQTFCGKSQ